MRFALNLAMRRVAWGLVPLAALGCASSPAKEQPKAPEVKVDEWAPQGPQPAWWNEARPCPDKAILVGAPPPKDHVIECRLPDGRRHGPSSVWFDNGHEGTLSEYRLGVRHGVWMHWLHGRKMVEGQYREGRAHGKWTYWFDGWGDYDTASRMDPMLPVVVETYNNGLLIWKEQREAGSPEEMSPAEQSIGQTDH